MTLTPSDIAAKWQEGLERRWAEMTQKPNFVIEHRETKERPLKVTLTRGAKGVYRWEIACHGFDTDTCLEVLRETDLKLFEYFGRPEREG